MNIVLGLLKKAWAVLAAVVVWMLFSAKVSRRRDAKKDQEIAALQERVATEKRNHAETIARAERDRALSEPFDARKRRILDQADRTRAAFGLPRKPPADS